MSIRPVLIIISSASPSSSERALATFSNFLGIECKMVSATENRPEALAEKSDGKGAGVLAIGYENWQRYSSFSWMKQLFEDATFILVFGAPKEAGPSAELLTMSGGVLCGFETIPAGPQRILINQTSVDQGSGGSTVSANVPSPSRSVFMSGPESRSGSIRIECTGRPYLVSVPKPNGGGICFLAESSLIDLNTSVTPETNVRAWYPQLFALSRFFREAFGSNCWSSPAKSANFIIDDPYLRPSYGFVRYDSLMGDLRRTGVSLTIAFIPFNFRRSERKLVERLRRTSDLFSIAVHGCDHTKGEYASLDEQWLEGTTTEALERMEEHHRQVEMPYERVMVFPQGRFSTFAIKALKRCGMEAAVNSSAWPENWKDFPLALGDLLGVAVTRGDGFPLFVRRYPTCVFDFAFDAEFQKPLLGVEHHEYLRAGFAPLETFAKELGNAVPNLHWMTLKDALASNYLIKRIADGVWAIRHYLNEVRFKNTLNQPIRVELEKVEADDGIESVIVNGQEVPFECRQGWLRYSVAVPPGATIEASVFPKKYPVRRRMVGVGFRLKVWVRRRLSDFRDNVLARNPAVLDSARKILKRFSWAK